MRVFNRNCDVLGHCDVFTDQIVGMQFAVSIAEQGKFRTITYDLLLHGDRELVLVADPADDAKFLPGFEIVSHGT